jgi:hypothetical protein
MDNYQFIIDFTQKLAKLNFKPYLKSLDEYIEKKTIELSKENQYYIRKCINVFSLGIFGITCFTRRRMLMGFGRGLTFYIISSLMVCRDNLNPYSKYKI